MDIAGKYNVSIVTNAQFTYNDNNRDAQFVPPSPNVLAQAYCVQIDGSGFALCCYDANVTIRRARIIPSGGFGTQPPEKKRAAQVYLKLVKNDFTELDTRLLKFPSWGEWYDINATLRPHKTRTTWTDSEINQHKPVYFMIDYVQTYFNVDDYNIGDAYKSQTMTPILEMELETSGGMIESSQYNIF